MAGRRIRDRADARACLVAVATSGLTRRDWAVANGVDARSLNMWRVILERQRRTDVRGGLRLVELVAEEPPAPLARYVVRVGTAEVEVDGGFDERTLRRLLRVVASC